MKNNVRILRKAMGLTQEQLAKKVGISRQSLSNLNNFKTLLKNGIKIFFVKFIYLIFPLVLFLLTVTGSIPRFAGLIITGVLFVVLYVYCFIAIANMVYHDSFKKAFALNEISIVKNNIGWLLLFGLLMTILFIFYGVTAFLDEFIIFLGNFININAILFDSFTVYKLLLLLISSLTVQPFIDILTARIAGVIYENGSET
ncbi:MAG: DUF4013 domain-containing protein [Methanobrevibacter sp.]|uniref:DUF4013 domain-containing protein n=1 Tax=Methanobrevibacter sp. TaxID=66852 RepID=UPI0025F7FA8B|nr:DUF4013 domain-containing protein [Methanobrevibacter sp.]MBQ8017866.1 DUF4013 domain-containing protein [Methanobrevibacter sp.]